MRTDKLPLKERSNFFIVPHFSSYNELLVGYREPCHVVFRRRVRQIAAGSVDLGDLQPQKVDPTTFVQLPRKTMTRGDVDIYPKRSKAPSVQELLGLTLQRRRRKQICCAPSSSYQDSFLESPSSGRDRSRLETGTYSIIGFSDSLEGLQWLGPSLFAQAKDLTLVWYKRIERNYPLDERTSMHSPASVQTQQRSPAGISTALVRPDDLPVVSGPEPLSQSGAVA